MERSFVTHEFRNTVELNGLWDFETLDNSLKITQKLAVPSCWEMYPCLETYQGKAGYTKYFSAGGNIRICFKGISHTANVYFDDTLIRTHYNAYTPFDIIIKNAENKLHKLYIEVDNSFSDNSALHVPNDYYSYGGITRTVVLEKLNKVYIRNIHFTPYKKDGTWHGNVSISVENLDDKPTDIMLNFELNNKSYELSTQAIPLGITVIEKDYIFEDVKTYELNEPNLYFIRALLYSDKTLIDDLIERIGFREVSVDGSRILFNNKKITLKGFNRHEDWANFGCSIPYSAMDYDLNLMLDMNANAVRTCHYPNDELFLDLCDERGILVWEEGHARGLNEEQMRNKNFRSQSLNCIDEMINAHYNHPAIFVWGILNECATHTEYGKMCAKEQFDLIRSLDTSRPLTFASCHHQKNKDISLDLPDIVSMNIYPLWYSNDEPKQYNDTIYNWVQETDGKGKPYIISEIGAGAIYGYRNATQAKWTEERQASILERQLKTVFENENMSGLFIWQFSDCRVNEEWFANRPKTMNNKGIVDENRKHKLAYETVKNIFKQIK